MIVHSFILIFLVSIAPVSTLVCYDCDCDETNIAQCDCGITTNDIDDYCVITEQRSIDGTYIVLTRVPRNTTYVYIEDSYYILAVESIRYNLTTKDWYTYPSAIIFGCDWDRCNAPDRIETLPDSFTVSINKTWLDMNIYGNGSVDSCHSCPYGLCADSGHPFNVSGCPLTLCANATSCLTYDFWYNLDTDDQCLISECAPSYLNGELVEYYGGKYRIDVEVIVYLARNRSTFDIWEIDVYCAVYNCTRSTIFQEISQQLVADITNLSSFPFVRPTTTTTTIPTTTTLRVPVTCYSCDCLNSTTCPCNDTVTVSMVDSYCVMVRYNFSDLIYVYLDATDYYSSSMYVYEFPYSLVEESINYDEQGGFWFTTTNLIVYGCNWNLCNKPELLPLLPDSFQMRLPDAWLNTSVLGSGAPVHDCHECSDTTYCATTDYLDANVCPIQPCNTTCAVTNTYDDPDYDYLCYYSYCLDPELDNKTMNRHRIEIEGVVYASEPTAVHIWEIDMYCRADNCSSPTVFRELHEQLTLQAVNLAALFNETHDPSIPQRRCYDCNCYNKPNCTCTRTTILPVNASYCIVSRQVYGKDLWVNVGHLDLSSTRIYIRDFPFLLSEESIAYNEGNGSWTTTTNAVIYGCNWDLCNDPYLANFLPTSFQMRLNETWLNTSVLGTGTLVRNCHECPYGPVCSVNSTIDETLCPIRECNTTCLVNDVYDDPSHGQQCYQSFCLPPDTEDYQPDRHRVEIEGIVYLHKKPHSVELWEVYIYCRADDCSRPGIFDELQSQLTVDFGNLSVFNITPPINTTTTTVPTSATTTEISGDTITCYDCSCWTSLDCPCNVTSIASSPESYCVIMRQTFDQDSATILQHVPRNSTAIYVREFPYILVEESILYNESSSIWYTRTNLVLYGCNTNLCNDPKYVPYLPDSFQMILPETWLNENIRGNGLAVRDCHNCPALPVCGNLSFVDGDLCPIAACNTTCVVSDLFDLPENNEQCYQSYCAEPDSEFYTTDQHRVEMEGILYLYPPNRPVELWEIYVFCRADNCSRPTIFDDIKRLFNATTGDLYAFYNESATTTTTTTTTTPRSLAVSFRVSSIMLFFIIFIISI